MAIKHGHEAVRTVARLLRAPGRVEDLLDDLPEGAVAVDPAPGGDPSRWLWHGRRPGQVGGWADPATYDLVDDPALRERLTRTVPADLGLLPPEEQRQYARRSVDLAMSGGATSAVVYPLAVCELARDLRVRNVGGTSAGAIAAAATAAAELARSTGKEGSCPQPGRAPSPGHVRAGYSGLADVLGWLLQLDGPGEPTRGREQLRLAQLFRPARSERAVFDVAVVLLRRRWWLLPPALAGAFGPFSGAGQLALALAAVLVLVHLTGSAAAPVPLLGALLVLWGLAAGTLHALTWRSRRSGVRGRPTTPRLRRLSRGASSRPAPVDGRADAALAGLLLPGAVALAVTGTVVLPTTQLLLTLVVALSLLGSSALLLLVAGLRWAGSARCRSYGLVAGATSAGRPSLLTRLAGAPRPTVDRALVPWLADSLAELAGLPGQVLCFGHLWLGPAFRPVPESPDGSATGAEEALRELATSPDRRLVNLEMMATDLSRRRPLRLPPPVVPADDGTGPRPEQLWFDPADLSAAWAHRHGRTGRGSGGRRRAGDGTDVLPVEVVEAMTSCTPSRTVPLADGTGEVTLHRLPHPWNLPVVVAVRISLALPLLFTAVRVYRLAVAETVRDDLGRVVHLDGEPVLTHSRPCVAEPLWLSDGGITSNFPVHLFDAYLPRWPSLGLDLGAHPVGQPVEDVRLPQDWTTTLLPPGAVGDGLVGLLLAVLGSARSWRDNLQASLPGFRSRVADVRQHPGEGGLSLFMPRATVAALALRGALAGARLRERFRDDAQWDRHRWLRLRVTAGSLEHLRTRLVRTRAPYEDLVQAGAEGLQRLAQVLPGDPVLPPPEAWYLPVDRFWPHVADVLDGLSEPPPAPDVVAGAPVPRPTFEQVPPT